MSGVSIAAVEAHCCTTLVATTDNQGYFSATASLPPGVYRFSAYGYAYAYVAQAFPQTDCFASCEPTAGTPFAVPDITSIADLDFSLHHGGRISVTLTADENAAPIADATVIVTEPSTGRTVEVPGPFYSSRQLPPGIYKVQVAGTPGYREEVYNNHVCSPVCDVANGDDVIVTLNGDRSLAIALQSGVALQGRLIDASGNPLAGYVGVYDSAGYVSAGHAGADGYYKTNGHLPPGDYVIRAESTGNFVAAVNPGISCFSCTPFSTGAHVAVSNQSVSGVDVVLQPGARISGVVRSTDGTVNAQAEPLLLDLNGNRLSSGSVNGTAGYSLYRLAPGDYRVRVNGWPFEAFVSVLYPNIPCYADIACDVSHATPIHVTAGGAVTGIDIVLPSNALFEADFD